MGIRGLQSYVEHHCQQACLEVDIPELVTIYKNETGNQRPVIVVDGSSCLRSLYSDLEWVTGGQMKQYYEKLIFFVNQFTNLGVTLVFFFDGPTAQRKRGTWVERRKNTMKDVYQILDLLAFGKKTTDISTSLAQLPPGVNFITQQILKNKCGCEVHSSIVDCDEEIADFARKNHCFAILGQDSDYMIFEGNYYYLSAAHLDIKRMKTVRYDRTGLAHRLRINLQDLPLLATLIGNDIVSWEDLRPFHRDVVKRARGPHANPSFQILFPCIADYVRKLPKGDALLRYLPSLAYDVFRDRSKADLIMTSLQSYSSKAFQGHVRNTELLTGWERILEEAKIRHITNYFPPMVYSILIGLPYEASTVIEDFRKSDLKSTTSIVRPLRQRIYGILLHEKPSGPEPLMVKEWCMEGPKSLDEAKLVRPIPPRAHHPGLLTLWEKNDAEVVNMKWNLFVNTISTKLEVNKVRCLPERIILPTLILCYLTEEKVLNDWEIDAILATAIVLEQYSTKRLSELPADPVSIRAIRIAPIIMRSASMVNFLAATCGHPMNEEYGTPCTYFDGKLFQIKYQAAEKKASMLDLCDNVLSLMEDFQKVKSVISSVL